MAVRQRYRLQQVLTALLRAHPEGLQVVDCWILVGPGRTYHTVYTALRRLCRKGPSCRWAWVAMPSQCHHPPSARRVRLSALSRAQLEYGTHVLLSPGLGCRRPQFPCHRIALPAEVALRSDPARQPTAGAQWER